MMSYLLPDIIVTYAKLMLPDVERTQPGAMWKIERRKSGVGGTVLNLHIGKACWFGDICINEGARTCYVGLALSFNVFTTGHSF